MYIIIIKKHILCEIFTWFIKIKGFEPRLITPQIDDKIVVLVVTILSLPPPTPHGVPGYKERQEVICQKKNFIKEYKNTHLNKNYCDRVSHNCVLKR